jgi:hypothetical protein
MTSMIGCWRRSTGIVFSRRLVQRAAFRLRQEFGYLSPPEIRPLPALARSVSLAR